MIKSTPPCCMECPRVEKCRETDCPEWQEWFIETWTQIQNLAKEENHE